MFGLTPLGIFHTSISLVAVIAGLIALLRDKAISPRNRVGRIYILATIITCLTGFGIFQHDGFGKPHALGIVTLVVLGIAWSAGHSTTFGRASPYIETVSYAATFLFHMIPGITETTTRLPLGAPLLPNAAPRYKQPPECCSSCSSSAPRRRCGRCASRMPTADGRIQFRARAASARGARDA
jgi:uncharacterized membrane protein